MDKLSPPKSVDPLTVLPRELAEIVLEYLSFRQRVNACMVTKQWARFIQSIPNLWAHLNLTGARKKVSNKFVSKAINVAKNKLTAATLNNLYDFDRALKALIRTCPLEELTLLKCGLQGQPLTDELSQAKHLKHLTLGNGTQLQTFQLRHLLQVVSKHIESFHCTLALGGMATIDGPTCLNLRILSLTFRSPEGLTSLLANISKRMPSLTSLTLTQTETNREARTGMHMDLDKCIHLEHLDLSLVFTSTSLLTLPQSIRTLRLNPMMVSNPDLFFRPIVLGIQPWFSLPNMEELTVDFPRLPIHLLKYMLASFKHIVSLSRDVTGLVGLLTQLQDMTPDGPVYRSKLRKLAVKGASSSAVQLPSFLEQERLTDLESLSLAGCLHFDDDAVEIITQNLSKLRTLDLSDTEISGIGVKEAMKQKHLERLIVNNCRHIGIDAIDWARSQGVQVDFSMFDNMFGGKKLRY